MLFVICCLKKKIFSNLINLIFSLHHFSPQLFQNSFLSFQPKEVSTDLMLHYSHNLSLVQGLFTTQI